VAISPDSSARRHSVSDHDTARPSGIAIACALSANRMYCIPAAVSIEVR
jgi:hypothetical protein